MEGQYEIIGPPVLVDFLSHTIEENETLKAADLDLFKSIDREIRNAINLLQGTDPHHSVDPNKIMILSIKLNRS